MDNEFLLCIYLCLIYLTTFGSSQNVECQDRVVAGNAGYTAITDDRRSAGYRTDSLDTFLCDRNKFTTGKWYRFVNSVGGRIPEECVPLARCMTLNPIWMSGAHPTDVGDIVTRMACANYGFDGVDNANHCCDWSADITVQLCAGVGEEDDFYIYQLVSPPFCHLAYCGGEAPPPCDEDHVLENGTCVEKCPIQAGNPVLSDPIQLQSSIMGFPPNDFEFTCTVMYPNPVNGLEKFEVTWLLNSMEDTSRARTIVDSSTNYTARIRGTELVGELGKTIQCRVRSFRVAHSGTSLCSPFYSNSYRMDVYPVLDSTPPIIIRDDAILSTEISFASTIPPVCAFPNIQCTVGGITVVTVKDDADDNGAVFQENRQCRADIFSSSWNSTTNRALSNAPFLVLARRDSCVDEPQNFILHFEQIRSFGNTPYLNYHIADIQFRTEDFAPGLCRSYNDPRIITFDGTSFGTQALGQFYLVRTNVPASPRLYEVQVRQWSCFGGRASCNCGIAIREGRTVLGIDHCNQNSPAPLLIQYSTDVDPGAGIFMLDSRNYKICMSSGACTRVRLREWSGNRWINLYVEALSRDRNHITGLCGNFDGDKSNDGNPQVETHRIPEGQSFFEGYIPAINGTVEADYELCECQEDSGTDQTLIHCGPVNGDDCMQNRGTPAAGVTMLDPTAVVNGKRRRKRQTNIANSDNIVSLADITYPFEYGENLDRNTDDLRFPTPSGTTEQEAEIMCKNDIDSAVALTDCLTLVGQDAYNNLVANCVDDLRITDNITVAGNIWEALEISCLRLAYIGVDSSGTIMPRNSSGDFVNVLKETVESGTCPNRCSNHGACANSICTCDTGFSGPDCAVQNGAAPIVTGMKELCSAEKKCQQTSLYSENGDFTEMDNTVCRVVSADVDLTDLSSHTRTSTVSTEATLVTAWEIICALPNSTVHSDEAAVSGFWVSLSYDGTAYSDERFVTIYDPICIECSGNLQTCAQKANTCLIDGSCFAEGDWKEDDSNFECRPNVHSDHWTCISAACKRSLA